MKCPYCENEMKLGNLCARGGGGMYWLPEKESIKFIVSNKIIEKHTGTVIVDCDEFGTLRHPAYLCPICRKVLMDY
ncbi:MAG: PF20097 family protein [Mobilitalea sp.]